MRLLPLFQLEQDGHTFVNYPMSYSDTLDNQGHGFFPFKVRFRDRHIYLQEDHSKQAVPAYAELLSINGRTVSEIVRDFEQIETMDRYAPLEPYMSYFFKHLLYPMHGWGGQYEITYQQNDSTITTTVQGISLGDFPSKPFHYWNYSTHTDSGYALLDLNLCEDYERFMPFCDSVFTDLNERQIPNLVIDIRGNSGGTTRHGDTLLTYLTDKPFTQYGAVETKHSTLTNPELDSSFIEIHSEMGELHAVNNPNRHEGKVFVLTDEITFSSAAIIAGTVQCFDIGTVIGRETGGTQIMYSSFYDLYLPNTGLFVGISTDRRHIPCGEHHDRGVIPDHEIRYEISDLKADRDLELEKVLELIQRPSMD